jgi:tRNA-dihydrouridine synthase B
MHNPSSHKLLQMTNFPLCLAPMVGLSHGALRGVLRSYTPASVKTIWPTEMLNSRKLPEQKIGTTPQTKCVSVEDNLVPQILANQQEPIRLSVKALEAWGAKGIDINMGCPVQKALQHNYGVALMGDADYAAQIVQMTVKSTQLPVSVKLRAGLQNNFDFLLNFVQGLEQAGASWIILHPRTAEQKRRGKADWQQIARLKDKISVPLIGNGDIQTADDVLSMQQETSCDLVMSGRALAARPWMMWQLAEKLGFEAPELHHGETAPQTAEEEGQAFGVALARLIDFSEQIFEPELALRKVRFHLRTTTPWLEFGHTLMSLSTKAKDLNQLRALSKQFFSQSQRMHQRTDLRQ